MGWIVFLLESLVLGGVRFGFCICFDECNKCLEGLLSIQRGFLILLRAVDSPYFRLGVGDYRVIMDIRDNELKIFVIEMAHRKKIYKK